MLKTQSKKDNLKLTKRVTFGHLFCLQRENWRRKWRLGWEGKLSSLEGDEEQKEAGVRRSGDHLLEILELASQKGGNERAAMNHHFRW